MSNVVQYSVHRRIPSNRDHESKPPTLHPISYKVIADMSSFDNLPAIHRQDVNGGGIYQVQEFNGKLYVVVCTGDTSTLNEETGTMRSFAIYVGENKGDSTNAESAPSAKAITLTKEQTQELVDGIKDGSIVPGSLAASDSADEASQLFDINNELDTLGSQLADKGSTNFANAYGEVVDTFFSISDIIPDKFKGLYETLVKLTSKANLKAYAKSLPYLAKSKRGFNLFEITDRSTANEGVTVGENNTNGAKHDTKTANTGAPIAAIVIAGAAALLIGAAIVLRKKQA